MSLSTPQTSAPILSTPETHIFEDPTPPLPSRNGPRHTDAEIWEIYEVKETARKVRNGGWRRVALQFPDQMLGDGVRVVRVLEEECGRLEGQGDGNGELDGLGKKMDELEVEIQSNGKTTTEDVNRNSNAEKEEDRIRFYILADTSYGSCCVDEIAAEHVNADVVIHYGRSCLSPTARLPVLYVFTTNTLSIPDVIRVFESTFTSENGKEEKVLLMADITYHNHIPAIQAALVEQGWKDLLVPEVIHDPSSRIPNRQVDEGVDLKEYSLFHISDPPTALLLTLSSRVKEMFIYPTSSSIPPTTTLTRTNTTMTLRRRYALLTSLSTCPIFGVLINTLSVKNYLSTGTQIRQLISSAGKKSYTFVVGKINAAKIANFAEVGGWVVIGCWESSLVENGEFYKPVITPFELGLVLVGDDRRVWDGDWRGDFGGVEELVKEGVKEKDIEQVGEDIEGKEKARISHMDIEDDDSEEESEPPEFDLRTGRYVSHSRPMRSSIPASSTPNSSSNGNTAASNALTRRAKGDLATVNGAVSPGAEFLRSQRTWTGLGSDFHEVDASQSIEEGRSGVARGYTVGEGERR